MYSSDLYHVKQQFILGAYKSITNITLPDLSAQDYTQTLLYRARAHIALNEPEKAVDLIPEDADELSLKAARALGRYVTAAGPSTDAAQKDAALEELRDLCVEIEGDDVSEGERGLVRVISGTAFAREGEVEEALETLGAGGTAENLEATALIVQIHLSINRPDLAKKEYERALRWAEDDVLLQFIEASIGLVTGSDGYANSYSFYTEQLGNPSLSSPHLLTSRGVTRLMRGEVVEAKSDLEEALKSGEDAETLCASVVAAGLGPGKKGDADELFSHFSAKYPNHPLVMDVAKKSEEFNQFAGKFQLPPKAIPATA